MSARGTVPSKPPRSLMRSLAWSASSQVRRLTPGPADPPAPFRADPDAVQRIEMSDAPALHWREWSAYQAVCRYVRRWQLMTQQEAPRLLVIQPIRDWACAACGSTRDLCPHGPRGPTLPDLRRPESPGLPSFRWHGSDRRATKASRLSAVVVRWSRIRKRYERRGVLV